MTDQAANERYELRMMRARVHLNNIKRLLKSHDIKSGDVKHWDDTGDLAQVNALLLDVELWLGGKK